MKLSPAARVAAGATAVIAVLYVIGVIVFNVLFASHQIRAERLLPGHAAHGRRS